MLKKTAVNNDNKLCNLIDSGQGPPM